MSDRRDIIPKEDLLDIEIAYAQLNAQKTVGSPDESEFRATSVGPLRLTMDPARAEQSYHQRILGLARENLGYLDEALESFAAAGLRVRVDVASEDGCAEVTDALTGRGFAQEGTLVYLSGRPESQPPTDVAWARWRESQADAFLDLLEQAGSPIDPAIREKRRPYLCTDRFRAFVVSYDGVPQAWATLFVHGDLGVLGNAFTFPEARGRGAQLVLFRRRIDAAARLGLRWVVTDVEPNTTSERNAVRAGLTPTTVQTVWTRRA